MTGSATITMTEITGWTLESRLMLFSELAGEITGENVIYDIFLSKQ